MPKTADEINYRELSSELDTIVAQLEDSDIDVDEALKRYERGMEIVDKLEAYLKTAQNEVKKIKARFDS
jgi:exodeoxyribonuclease VII small subunit